MKLALYRSITFWSGLLVMGFIGWAWRDSELHMSRAQKGFFSVVHDHSAVSVWWDPGAPAPLALTRYPVVDSVLRSDLFPAPLYMRGNHEIRSAREQGRHAGSHPTAREDTIWFADEIGFNSRVWFAPHWLLLLAVALSWSALLLWRARRRKRAAGIAE